jgi:hypothetical protein
MDGVRQQLLAGAGLAQQQHGGVGLRDAAAWRLTSSAAGLAPMKLAMVYLGRRCAASWRRVLQLLLQPRELLDQRLHRRLGVVQQHQAQRADHLARLVAQRQAADEEGAGLVGQQVHQHRLAGLQHLQHLRVGHHVFHAPADELVLVAEAQRRQEALVALADPDDAVVAVDHHHPFGRARQHVEHRLRGQAQQAVDVLGMSRAVVSGFWTGAWPAQCTARRPL